MLNLSAKTEQDCSYSCLIRAARASLSRSATLGISPTYHNHTSMHINVHVQRGQGICRCRLIIARWAKYSSYLRVEPFAALFWALGILLANNWPARPPAWHCSTAVQSAFPNMVNANCTAEERRFNSHRRRVALPPYSYLGMINLWGRGRPTEGHLPHGF